MRAAGAGPALLLVVLVLSGPATAHAATFYVDDSASAPANPCTDPAPAHACKHVMDAVTQARATNGGDLIEIAAGLYPAVVTLDAVDDAGDVLEGAGIPAAGHPGTTLGFPNLSSEASELVLGRFVPPLVPNISVRHLRVAVADAPNAPDGFTAVLFASQNGHLSDIEVDSEHSASSVGAGIDAAVGPMTIDNSAIHVTGTATAGLYATTVLGPLTVRDSLITAPVGGIWPPLQLDRGNVDVQRTRLVGGAATFEISGSGDVVATLDSTVLTRGSLTGIAVSMNGAGVTGTVLARHVTVDAGMPGVQDAAGVVAVSAAGSGGATAGVTLQDSIAVDQVTADPGGVVTCTTTDLPPGGACDPAANGNASPAPADLFPNGTNADYRLGPTSPAIDAGSAAPLAGDESPTDIAGAPRVLDGNFDCVVQSDRGANELTGQENTAPSVAVSGPTIAEAGVPAAFTASGGDAQDAAELLTYAWSFSDGLGATGPSITHAFAPLGAQSATATVADTHGCTASAVQGVTVQDTVAPTLTKLSLTHTTFRVGGKGASAAKKRPIAKGTTLKLTLSEPAKLTLTIVKRHAHKVLGTLRVNGKQGSDHVAFNGRAKHKKLKSGRYDLRVDAADPSGNKAKRHTLHFTIRR